MNEGLDEAAIVREFLIDYIVKIGSMADDLLDHEFKFTQLALEHWTGVMHQLKGSAGLFGYKEISVVAGKAEDLLSEISGSVPGDVSEEIKEYIGEINRLLKVAHDGRGLRKDDNDGFEVANISTQESFDNHPDICLITDDDTVRELIEKIFANDRFSIKTYYSIEEAIDSNKSGFTDILIFDLDTLRDGQLGKVKEALSRPLCLKTRVVYITSSVSIDLRREVARVRAVGLFAKPLDPHVFGEWVEMKLHPPENSPRVVVVDDDVHFLAGLTNSLAKEKIETFSIQEPHKSLEMILSSNPHLILLDISMPDIDGFELLTLLKQDPKLCFIPVIIVSGEESIERRLKAWELGADDFISKTVTAEMIPRIKARIRDAVQRQNLSKVDALTGLNNRRYFEEQYDRFVAMARSDRLPLACAMIDLDNFKKINDTYGHDTGDLVLREFGHLVKNRLRRSDLACRYGGEEFALVLFSVNAEKAKGAIDFLLQKFREIQFPIPGSDETFSVTFSAGIAGLEESISAADLVKIADKAMYKAKTSGRNRVEIA